MTKDAGAPGDLDALRHRAEKKLAKGETDSGRPEGSKDARTLLHELQVYQIELEMQNEELRRVQTELDGSRARYFDLYDLAPVGYCTVNEEKLILEANLAAATLLGVARSALIEQPLTRFILPADQDIYYQHRNQLLETHSASSGQEGAPQVCELRMLRAGGDPFWAQIKATVTRDPDGAPLCRVVMSDITERKQVEVEFRERATALGALNQAMLGRETRIIELKEEVDRLRAGQGSAPAAGAPTADSGDAASGAAERPAREENLAPPAPAPSVLSPLAPAAAVVGRVGWPRWVAGLVLLASLSATATAWFLARGAAMKTVEDRFNFRVERLESALRERLQAYEYMLRGGAGLFAASTDVTGEEWRAYVGTLNVSQHYPGVQGLGFSKRIVPADKVESTSIVFLEPFDWRNQRALGYDMFLEPVRREAMVRARDSGAAAMSGRVTLVQETNKDVQAGFLMYVPVYRNGAPKDTLEQRREALEGYVYSAFRVNDFMRGLLAADSWGIALQIFDGERARNDSLMFTSGDPGLLAEHNSPHVFARQSTIESGGHHWLLDIASVPAFEAAMIERGRMDAIPWLGLLTSLLLSGSVLIFGRSYRQAIALANMATDIEKTNRRLTAEVARRERSEEALRRHVADINAVNEVMIGRESRLIELKEEVNRLGAELGREPRYPPVWGTARAETDSREPAPSVEKPS